jgi:hypothetical protein
MPTLEAVEAIKVNHANSDSIVYGYYGRRVEVRCTNGLVFTGKVGWYVEDMGEDDNEWGISFDDVTDSAGNTLSGYDVEIPHIELIIPLERANTEEEIKKLFG